MRKSWTKRAQPGGKLVGFVRIKCSAFSHVVANATGLRKSLLVFPSFYSAFTNSFFTSITHQLTAFAFKFSPSSTRPIIKTTNI